MCKTLSHVIEMDFDPKCFYTESIRMKEDLKEHIRDFSSNVLEKIKVYADVMFKNEKLNEKHVKFIILAMSVDPITCYNKNGLCVQNISMKPICRIICNSIDIAMNSMTSDKYGGIDKKVYKACKKGLINCRCATSGILACSVVISELLGIRLQSTIKNVPDVKTLNLEIFQKESTLHKTAKQTTIPYSSLLRFINIVERFKLEVREGTKNKVSFDMKSGNTNKQQPTTPDICFWED